MLKHPRSLRTAKVGKKAKILKRQICQSIHVRVTVGATTADSNWGHRMLHTLLLLDLKLNRLRMSQFECFCARRRRIANRDEFRAKEFCGPYYPTKLGFASAACLERAGISSGWGT